MDGHESDERDREAFVIVLYADEREAPDCVLVGTWPSKKKSVGGPNHSATSLI